MKRNFWDKRFPTLLGILLITIGIGITTFLVNQGVLFKSNASATEQPQNVRITNITDASFSVSYYTDASVIGALNYGKDDKLGQSALDDRDQQAGTLASHTVHNITIRSLSAQTKYYFAITSGQNNYLNGDHLFEVTTGSTLSQSPPKQDPISGKIVLSDGSPPKETIIYLTADGSQVISTLVKSDGTYILPLNSLRSADFVSYYDFSSNANIKMLVFGDSLTSNISLSLDQTHPVPIIILSKDYDFRNSQLPNANAPANSQSFPSFSSTSSATLQILSPKNNQEFTDQQPLFKGTGTPNQSVKITIHSDQALQTTITVDKNGNWNYRPSSNLSSGTHTITVQSKDASGVLQTISQSFVVYAAGQQINPPAPSVIPTATPTKMISPTATPTLTQIAVLTTPMPTRTQTKGGIAVTPTKAPLVKPGNPFVVTAGIIGAFITIVGGAIILLTREGIQAL